MIRVFVIDKQCLNVDNDLDAKNLLQQGAIEVKDLSIFKGYESEVSPLNTTVNNDGTITFNLDVEQEQNKSNLQETQTKQRELQSQLDELMIAHNQAVMLGDTELAEQLKTEYQSLVNGS